MRPLSQVKVGELLWEKPSLLRGYYELRAGGETVATLRWPRWWSRQAVGECAEGRWRLHPCGFFGRSVEVRADAGDAVVARFERDGWLGGRLEFTGGPSFRWRRHRLWQREWWLTGPDEVELLELRQQFAWLRTRVQVRAQPAVWEQPKPALLLLVSGYQALRWIRRARRAR